MPWLFSYGTLRQPDVQLATFGRLLNGHDDNLPGYVIGTVRIVDPAVVMLSGAAVHPILRPSDDPDAAVPGMALDLTGAELAAADAYEDPAYMRIGVTLRSGRNAFAYVARD
jgi:hypothetical protein